MPINVGELGGSLSLEDLLSQTIDKIHAKLTLAGVDFDELNKKVVVSATTMGQAANVQVALQSELAKTSLAVNQASSQLSELAKYSSMNTAVAKALEPAMQTTSRGLLEAKSAADALKSSMALMNKEFNTVNDTAKITSAQIVSMGRGIQEVGVVLSAAVTAPLVAAGAASINFAGDFERAMNKASILGGLTASEMKGFEQTVLDIGQAMGVAPKEVAVGLDIIGSAMYKGAEATDILTKATKMAALGMGTVEETTRAVVGAMLTFKKENLTAAQASDMLLKTVQVGNMKIGDLVGALAKVNPLAAAMGVHFSDVNAAIATFTHLGAPAEVAGTGIRAVLSNILNDSKETEKGLKGLGISMADLQQHMKEDLVGALLSLVEAADKIPDGMAKLNDVFPNIRALTLVLADAKAQGKQFRTIGDDIKAAAGSVDVAMGQLKGTWVQQWNEMVATVQVFAIKVGKELMPTLKNLATFVKEDILPAMNYFLDVFKNLPNFTQVAIFGIAGLAAVLGPLLIIVGETVRAWGHLSVLWKSEAALKMIPSLKTLQTELKLTESAGKAAGIAVAGIGAAAAVAPIIEFGKEIKNLNDTGMEQYKTQLAELEQRHKTLAEATRIAGIPIIDFDKAVKIVAENVAKYQQNLATATANTIMFGPATEEATKGLAELKFRQDLVAAAMDVTRGSVEKLRPEVRSLTNEMFQHGLTSAEAFKILKAHNLVLDEQKIAIENLHDVYAKQVKLTQDIVDANLAVTMATVPLTEAQRAEAEQLLALGIAHEDVAFKIGAHIAQVQALIKADAEHAAAMKSELEGIDNLSKIMAKSYEATQLLGATESERIQIKAMADYDVHVKMLSDKGVQDVKYYDQAWDLMNQDVKNANQARLLNDSNSKAHLLNKLENEKEYYQFMLANSGQYTQAERDNQKKTIDGLKEMRDHWGKVGDVVKGVTASIKSQSDEITSMFEAAKKFNDSIVKTEAPIVNQLIGKVSPIGQAPENINVSALEKQIRSLSASIAGYVEDTKTYLLYGADAIAAAAQSVAVAQQHVNDVSQLAYLEKMLGLAKDAQKVTESMGKQICACGTDSSGNTGSSATAAVGSSAGIGSSVPGGGSVISRGERGFGVNIASGAVVMQFPIMKDKQTMNQVAGVVGEALVQKMIAAGWRPPLAVRR